MNFFLVFFKDLIKGIGGKSLVSQLGFILKSYTKLQDACYILKKFITIFEI